MLTDEEFDKLLEETAEKIKEYIASGDDEADNIDDWPELTGDTIVIMRTNPPKGAKRVGNANRRSRTKTNR
jgi:hypothetical protein